MPAYKKDFLIEQGSTWEWYITSNSLALAGYSAEFMARENLADTTKVINMSTANSLLTITNNQIHASLAAASTAALTTPTMVYDMEITSPLGKKIRILEGRINLSKEVTR
jgi:hypothetical protein